MTSYFRFFSPSPDNPFSAIQTALLRAGYQVEPLGTQHIAIYGDDHPEPATLEITDSNNPTTRAEITHFLDAIAALPVSEDQLMVLSDLALTKMLIALGIPDEGDYSAMLEVIAAHLDEGLTQIDRQGFFRDGELVLDFI